ncbi:hypothetical protein FGL97_12760 [Pseudomonas putida]|nr:hypothetical protein [Pseudomonas putida]NVN68733.1 hypothetical protein [Pseudomonas putida]
MVTYTEAVHSTSITNNCFVYVPALSKLAAVWQLEKKLIKLEFLVKNLRKRQKRLISSIAG